MGDVKPRLRQAQQMINAGIGIVLRCSHVYESKAWGFTAADDFKNQAMEVDTDLAPEELLAALQEIEGRLGRDREAEAAEKARTGEPYSSRLIDIDIIFYDDAVVDTPRAQAAASADAGAGFRACSACRDSAGEGASRSGKNG